MGEITRYARLQPQDIGLLNTIVVGWESLACVRTIDPEEGLVAFWVPEDLAEEFDDNLQALVDWLPLEILDGLPAGMTPEERRQHVEDACAAIILSGQPVTFDEVAERTGLGRATLYLNPDLRTIIEEHRARGREAHTLTGLTTEIAHLRTALEAVAATVRRHEEELRRLRKPQR